MKQISPFVLLLPAVLLAACGDADSGPATLVQRDSAGVRIVENPRPADDGGPLWRVAAEPETEIGVADGGQAYTLSRVVRALQLRDGGVVLADEDSREIRFFDAGGKHVRSVGRRGGGPGEFQSLSGLARFRGDSLAAWDNRAGRLSILAPDGRFARAVTPRELAMYPRFFGAFADGSWLVSPGFNPGSMFNSDRAGEHRTTLTLLRMGPEGELLDTLGSFPGLEVIASRQGIVASNDRVVFGRDFEVAVGNAHVYGGDTDRFEVRAFSKAGAVERVVRLARAPVRVTDTHVELNAEKEAEGAKTEFASMSPGMRAAMEQAAAAKTEIPHRPTFPAFARILVDDRDNVWVADYPAPGATRVQWRIFDPSGVARGFVDVPSGLLVQDVAGGYLLGIERDDDGVERVRRYRLEGAA
jgi:hypothetical protein